MKEITHPTIVTKDSRFFQSEFVMNGVNFDAEELLEIITDEMEGITDTLSRILLDIELKIRTVKFRLDAVLDPDLDPDDDGYDDTYEEYNCFIGVIDPNDEDKCTETLYFVIKQHPVPSHA